jgi:hypothetical protein
VPEAGPARQPTGARPATGAGPATGARPATGAGPAIGPGGRLPRRALIRRYALALALILLLGVAKMLIAPGTSVGSMIQPGRVVTPGLIIGAAPTDTELQELAADLQVDAVVNLGAPSVAERAAATSLHQAYLYLAVAQGDAPTLAQLRLVAGFVRRYTGRGGWVYLHDDVDGGRAETTAAMLLLWRGQPWSAVSAQLTPAARGSLSKDQRLALDRLRSALTHGGAPPTEENPT